MKIGIIGAGRMAQAVGLLATRAGHQVMLSNSRGPETIRRVGQQIGCEVGTVGDVAFSECLDMRNGHPADKSTELRINGDSTPHGQD